MTLLRRAATHWPLALAVAVQAVLLASPLLRTGYINDDQVNSLFHWSRAAEGRGFWDVTGGIIDSWIQGEGRLYPLSFVQGYGQFELIHDLKVYKLILLLWVLASTVAVFLVLVRMGIGERAAALVLVGVGVLFQFRVYLDPIVAFNGLMPAMLILTALSLWLFQGWLRDGGRVRLAGSIVLYVLAAMTYESAYVFTVFHLAVAVVELGSLRRGLRASTPLIVPTLVLLGIAAYLRATATSGGEGIYQPRLEPGPMVEATLDQLSAALPLSYAGLGSYPSLRPRWDVLVSGIGFWALVVGIVVGLAAWALLRGGDAFGRGGRRATWQLAVVGVLMWVVSAVPIAVSRRYQDELSPGVGHIPVYVEYFGFAMLAYAALRALAQTRLARRPALRTAGVAALAVAIGTVGALTYRANSVVAGVLAPSHERYAMGDAAEAGLLRDVPATSQLAWTPNWPFHQPGYWYKHTRRHYEPVDVTGPDGKPTATGCRPRVRARWMLASARSEVGWYAAVACRSLAGPAPGAVWLEDGEGALMTAQMTPVPGRPPSEAVTLALRPDERGVARFSAPRGLELSTLTLQRYDGEAAVAVLRGCEPPMATPVETTQWCPKPPTLAVDELSGEAQDVILRVRVAADRERGTIRLPAPCGRRVRVTETATTVSCGVSLPAGGRVELPVDTAGLERGVRLVNLEVLPA